MASLSGLCRRGVRVGAGPAEDAGGRGAAGWHGSRGGEVAVGGRSRLNQGQRARNKLFNYTRYRL